MGIVLVGPCMSPHRSLQALRWRSLLELGILLVISPGRSLTGADALDEPLSLLLLKLSRSLCAINTLPVKAPYCRNP